MNRTSKIAIGTVQFGLDYGISNDGGKVSLGEASEILAYAKEIGINCIDTAQAYNSEGVLGSIEVSKNFNVISKFSSVDVPIYETFNKSLELLNASKVYGYLAHSFSIIEKNLEHYKKLIEFKREGLIQKVGVSLYHPEEARFILKKEIEVDLIQIPYSIFDQRFNAVLPELKAKGIEIHSRSTFLQGLIFLDDEGLHPYFNSVKNKLKRFHDYCNALMLDASCVALNFVIANQFIDKVVLGITSTDELKSNIGALDFFELVKDRMIEIGEFEIKDEKILLPYLWKIK